MSAVLVTGGAGFIGSHVVDALIAEGQRVVAVDDLSSGTKAHLNPGARFYELDICDPKLRELFERENIDWIDHHAAQIDVRKSVADPQRDARINIEGLLNLLQCALKHNVKGIVFASSGGVVYGQPAELPVRETYPKGPLSPYGVSKLASEYYLYCYHRVHGLPAVSLRYGNVYGPRQDPHGEAGVVAIFAGQMLRGERPTIFGDGEQLRDYVYVSDVARANLAALHVLAAGVPPPRSLDDHAFNIGTGAGTSVDALFRRLKAIVGYDGEPRYGPERAGELRRIYLNIERAERELGWRPEVGLDEGLGRTVEFFR